MRGCHPCVHLFFSVCNKLILRFNDGPTRSPRAPCHGRTSRCGNPAVARTGRGIRHLAEHGSIDIQAGAT